MLKLNKLEGVIPKTVIAKIPSIRAIDGPLRLSYFLSQCAHESLNFTVVRENLNYSADGLLNAFEKYFTPEQAKKYARDPVRIASRVYANRMGNGDEASQDGWNFRGRGFIQLTGQSNYEAFGEHIDYDVVSNPDIVAVRYALESAAFFFDKSNLWNLCDKGSSKENVKAVTKVVNGGYNGLDDRIARFNRIYALVK